MNGHFLALDHLAENAMLRPRLARGHDVNIVSSGDESGSESLGEPGCTVHVGKEGVGTDEHGEAAVATGMVAGRRAVGRVGGSHRGAAFAERRSHRGMRRHNCT